MELFLVDIGKDDLCAATPLLEQVEELIVEFDLWLNDNGDVTRAEGFVEEDNIGDGDLAWRAVVGIEDFFAGMELFKVDSRFDVATN